MQGLEEMKSDPAPDQESAFWDNLLAKKEGEATIEPVAAATAPEAAVEDGKARIERKRPRTSTKGILRMPDATAANGGATLLLLSPEDVWPRSRSVAEELNLLQPHSAMCETSEQADKSTPRA